MAAAGAVEKNIVQLRQDEGVTGVPRIVVRVTSKPPVLDHTNYNE
jgi:hypothetical protein